MDVGNVGDHASEFERNCKTPRYKFCSRSRGKTNSHDNPPFGLARAHIINRKRPIAPRSGQYRALGCIEPQGIHSLCGCTEGKVGYRHGLGFVPQLDEVRARGEGGLGTVMVHCAAHVE